MGVSTGAEAVIVEGAVAVAGGGVRVLLPPPREPSGVIQNGVSAITGSGGGAGIATAGTGVGGEGGTGVDAGVTEADGALLREPNHPLRLPWTSA